MADLLDELRDSISAARYSSASVLASLAVSIGLSLLLFITFLVLRRRIQTLYASKPHRSVRSWPYPGNALFAWVRPIWQTSAADLHPRLGLDAVVFLRYLWMLRNMFLVMAVVGCGAGIPVNIYFNWKSAYADSLSKEDAFVLMTPTLLSGKPLIAHVVMGWVLTLIVLFHLGTTFSWILRLRRDYYADIQHRALTENRTLMVVDVDRAHRTDDGLRRIAAAASSERPLNASVGRDVKHLEQLLDEHLKVTKQYERANLRLMRSQKKGYTATSTAHDKAAVLSGVRGDLEQRIRQERHQCRKENKPLGYGFISYSTQNEAHKAAKETASRSVEGAHLRLAPHPSNLLWNNLSLNVHERRGKKLYINILYTCLLLLWIVPVAFLGCFLTNFKRIGTLWPAFEAAMEAHTVGFAVLQGVVAPFLTVVIFMLLPPVLRKMSNWEGSLTRTDREHEVMRKLFVLFFLVNYIVFTCMGVIWDVVAEVISIVRSGQGTSFHQVWDELELSRRFATAVIDVSSFWVMYLLRSITELFTSLAQVLSLLVRSYERLFTDFTPRDRARWTEPQAFPYSTTYIWTGFYTSIALGLTVVQPLVLAINAVYFAVALPFKKYELMYMYYTKYESHGAFWPLMHNIIVFSTIVGNLVLLCVVWVQASWNIAVALAPLPVVVLIYKLWSYFALERKYWYFIEASDSEKEMSALGEAGEARGEALAAIYENPMLHVPLAEPILARPVGVKADAAYGAAYGVYEDTCKAEQGQFDAGSQETYEGSPSKDFVEQPQPFADPYVPAPYAEAHPEAYPDEYPEAHEYPGADPDEHPGIAYYAPYSQAFQNSPSCPYPEEAMSSTHLDNYREYQDDQTLLQNNHQRPKEPSAHYYGRFR